MAPRCRLTSDADRCCHQVFQCHGRDTSNDTIAAFLIGAGDGHFLTVGGWDDGAVTGHWSPDFERPLGPPLADATYDHATATWHRSFAGGAHVTFTPHINANGQDMGGTGTVLWPGEAPPQDAAWRFSASITLPEDNGQPLGTLFEVMDGDGQPLAHVGSPQWSSTSHTKQDQELVFHVAEQDAVPRYQKMGRPFPEALCQTRCDSVNGSLFATNRNVPDGTQAAKLLPDGSWQRMAPFGGLDAYQGVQRTCGGIITPAETTIKFNGRVIFQLDTKQYIAHMTYFSSGRFLIYAFSHNATIRPNEISVGKWSCGDETVSILASYNDPAPVEDQMDQSDFPVRAAATLCLLHIRISLTHNLAYSTRGSRCPGAASRLSSWSARMWATCTR